MQPLRSVILAASRNATVQRVVMRRLVRLRHLARYRDLQTLHGPHGMERLFGVDLIAKSGETDELKRAIIADAEVIFAAAAAGVSDRRDVNLVRAAEVAR